MFIDLSVLVSSPQKNNVLGKFDLEREEEQDSLDTLISSVYIVSQEKIVGAFDISKRRFIVRSSKCFKESINLM